MVTLQLQMKYHSKDWNKNHIIPQFVTGICYFFHIMKKTYFFWVSVLRPTTRTGKMSSKSRPIAYWMDPVSRSYAALNPLLRVFCVFTLKQLHHSKRISVMFKYLTTSIHSTEWKARRKWLDEIDTTEIDQRGSLDGYRTLVFWSASGQPSLLHLLPR